MVVLCPNFFQQLHSNGQLLKNLSGIHIAVITQEAVFYKWILKNSKKELYESHNAYLLPPD